MRRDLTHGIMFILVENLKSLPSKVYSSASTTKKSTNPNNLKKKNYPSPKLVMAQIIFPFLSSLLCLEGSSLKPSKVVAEQ